jgi:enoyl-[acyl-carrier protein] reductase III
VTPLDGRVAVVTGGSRGMGRAVAVALARAGADCAITYRSNAAAAHQVTEEVKGLGRRALMLPLDLREPDAVGPAIERVGETFGRIDVLVANAAATAFRPMLDQKLHNVERTFAISVKSFIAAAQAAAPLMAGGAGRIIAISGVDSHQAMAGHGVLGAAKAAMESLVRTFALELGSQGITVNGVSPGFIDTDSSHLYVQRGLGVAYDDAAARLAAATPLRRVGTVEDVAGLVAFLASDAAGFITGQTIVIDGGLTIVSPMTRLADDDRLA